MQIIKGAKHVDAYLNESVFSCPICGNLNIKKNGHKTKTVKHCTDAIYLYVISIHLQCYVCPQCKHRWKENDNFSDPYEQISIESKNAILSRLREHTQTFESIAKQFHVTFMEVIHLFDSYYSYTPPNELPSIMCWDEKYKNKSKAKSKYMFIIFDFLKNNVYDIKRTRHSNYLSYSYKDYSLEKRDKVKFIIIDMWEPYKDLAINYFRKAIIAVDSFHVMKHVKDALDKIRKNVIANIKKERMEALRLVDPDDYSTSEDERFYLLTSHKELLFSLYNPTTTKSKYNKKLNRFMDKNSILTVILKIDPDLKKAYQFYQSYLEFNRTCTYKKAEKELNELIDLFYESNLKPFIELSKTLTHWKDYIVNSFIRVTDKETLEKRRLSNGPIEGYNTIIEVLLRNSRGIINDNRLIQRIIVMINKNVPILSYKVKKNRETLRK